MAELTFVEIEGRAVAKGVSGGRGFAFVFDDGVGWGAAPGLATKFGSSLSQTDLAKEFREAYSAIDELYRLAKDVPEIAFG